MERRYEIWKDGHLYLKVGDLAEANKLYDLVRKTFRPRVLVLFEKEILTKLLRDND